MYTDNIMSVYNSIGIMRHKVYSGGHFHCSAIAVRSQSCHPIRDSTSTLTTATLCHVCTVVLWTLTLWSPCHFATSVTCFRHGLNSASTFRNSVYNIWSSWDDVTDREDGFVQVRSGDSILWRFDGGYGSQWNRPSKLYARCVAQWYHILSKYMHNIFCTDLLPSYIF